MRPAITLPPGIDREHFLRDYWQKRPLLMRAALAAELFSLEPDELAGLACEPDLESRLLLEHQGGAWEVRHGPFADEDFAALPESRWTLLVQDVDKYLPDVARLIGAFDFVPGWRIDDIMVSYAADGGGVGPHTDAYDVFLMQAFGRRRWRLSYRKYTEQDLLPGLEQRILAHFDTDEDWVLEPGDILYLPPGVAHWGIAEGECMTYSLGFRAPSQREIASDWFQHLVDRATDRRLADPEDLRVDSPAELSAGAAHNAATLIDGLPGTGSRDFRLWLGRYLTEPKSQFEIEPPDRHWDRRSLGDWLVGEGTLLRHPFARLGWTRLEGDEVALFVQGRSLVLPGALTPAVKRIAETPQLDRACLEALISETPAAAPLIVQLLDTGILEPEPLP